MYKQREGLLPVPLYVLQVRTTHIRAHEMRYIFVCTVTGLECRDTFTYTVWHVARVSDSHSTTRKSAENLTGMLAAFLVESQLRVLPRLVDHGMPPCIRTIMHSPPLLSLPLLPGEWVSALFVDSAEFRLRFLVRKLVCRWPILVDHAFQAYSEGCALTLSSSTFVATQQEWPLA